MREQKFSIPKAFCFSFLFFFFFFFFDVFFTALLSCNVVDQLLITEAVVRRCSIKKVFLEISLNSQENTCARVSFLIKRDSGTGVFL